MRRSSIVTILSIVVLTVSGAVAATIRDVPPALDTRFITDDQGRALLLHGFNTASNAKSTPDGLPELTEADVDREYTDMGTNFVRFLLQWRAVEPEPGQYDDTYLSEVAQRIQWYADRGYHVMLDMHQDLYSQFVTPSGDTGDGAPPWATRTDGLDVAPQEQWELVYLEPGVMRAFDNFWGNTDPGIDLVGHYADSWRHVAEYFADDPAVLGYDLMNEPWGGAVQGAAFETGPLAQLYQDCLDRVREVDPDSWVFVAPQAVGVNWGLPSALPALDDPRDGEPRIAYAPHLYPLPMDLGDSYSGDGRATVDATLDLWRDNVVTTAKRLDAPILLGEFGLDPSGPGALDYVDTVTDLADADGMGWAYWSRDPGGWGPYSTDGQRGPLVDVLNRAYPRAVAGLPREIDYDADDPRLTVGFDSVDGVIAPTEIYLPESFGDGGSVDCDHGCETAWDAETRVLSVTTDNTVDSHIVTVTPK